MYCSKCGKENLETAKFCVSCGESLKKEQVVNEVVEKSEVLESNGAVEVNGGMNGTVNVVTPEKVYYEPEKKKTLSKWITIGIPVLVVVVALVFYFSDSGSNYSDDSGTDEYYSSDNGGSSYQSDTTKFGNYLVNKGWRKNSSTQYVMYSDDYVYMIDFEESFLSIRGDSIFSAYFYKTDIGGVVAEGDGFEITSLYNYGTSQYSCEADPTSYSYVCSSLRDETYELGLSLKKYFYSLISGAGVSVSGL